MINVLVDTSPLGNDNAVRGVGAYTRFLTQELEKIPELQVARSTDEDHEYNECDFDLVHYPYFDLFFSTLPLVRCAKSVVTVHDLIPLKFPEAYPPGKKGKLRYYRQLFALHTVHGIITDSQASKKDIVEILRIPEHKVHVVYLAANPELHHVSLTEVRRVREKFGLPQRYVLYVGDINFNKNIPELIKMVKYLPPEFGLVCVGKNFRDQEIPEWEAIVREVQLHDVGKRVFLVNGLGADAAKDLSAIYSGAMLYVQPSLYEGFGLPVLEAMQCGIPVVASYNSSLIEVGGQCAKFVHPTAESMAQGVIEVLQLPVEQRAKLIAQGHAWSKHFSWKKTAEQTADVYEKILAGSQKK